MSTNGERPIGVLSASFHDAHTGEQVLAELEASGFDRIEISGADAAREAGDGTVRGPGQASYAAAFFKDHESTTSSFIAELREMGFSIHDAGDVVNVLVGGGSLVTVDASSDPARAVAILEKYHGDIRYATTVDTAAAAIAAAAPNADSAAVIALREERLEIQKHRVQHGEARVRKEVVTHIESIKIPVRREELVVENVSFESDGTELAIDPAGVIRIPLSQEVISVTKTVAATEEVRIGKRLVQGTEHVSETVREEHLRVSNTAQSGNGDR